jgi:hypothetical protein
MNGTPASIKFDPKLQQTRITRGGGDLSILRALIKGGLPDIDNTNKIKIPDKNSFNAFTRSTFREVVSNVISV